MIEESNKVLNYRGLEHLVERLKTFFIKNPKNHTTGRYLKCINDDGGIEWADFPAFLTFKGTVNNYEQLPSENNSPGDVWKVDSTGAEYYWTLNLVGTTYVWEYLGELVKLTKHAGITDTATVGQVLVSKSNGSGGITYEWKTLEENTDTLADWNETNTSSPAYINNKPTIPLNTLHELTISDDLYYSINVSYSDATHNLIYLTDTSEGNTFTINVNTSMTSSTPKEIIYHINAISSVALVIQKTSGDSGVLESYASLTDIEDSVEIVFTFWKNGLVTYNGGSKQ